MIKFYNKAFSCLATLLAVIAMSGSMSAQTIVVPTELDDLSGFRVTFLNEFVEADTSATGEQNNSTYLLEAGGIYFWTARETWDFDVMFGATGDVAALGRPFLGRVNKTGGNISDMYRGTGSIGFDGLEFEMGEEGPNAATYEVASIRPQGDGYTVSFNDCIIYKSRQALARCDGPNVSAFVTNCHIYNLGDYGQLQGNGRVIDVRNGPADSVVIRNNYIHQVLDRIYIGFRQASANYVEISKNTIFNHAGRHGFIQLNNTLESVIEDNLFINPSVMGSSPARANEQINSVGEQIYLLSLDTVLSGASAIVRNNNISYSQNVLDFYNEIDTVFKPNTMSPVLAGLVGDTTNSLTYESVTLANVPSVEPIISYARDTYADPAAAATDIMVEDISVAGTPDDNGNLFDFSAFDPCYPLSAGIATGSTLGGAIGATWLCEDFINSTRVPESYNSNIQLSAVPNPASEQVQFKFLLTEPSNVVITVYDVAGRGMVNAFEGQLGEGTQRIDWSGVSTLHSGMHLVEIQTKQGRMVSKLMVD